MTSRIPTLLVDDDILFRQLVKYELEDSGLFAVVGQAGEGAEGIRQARERSQDLRLVLLDLEMPGVGGVEALPRLLEAAPHARVVVLSMREDLEATVLGLGATAFVHKSLGAGDLVRRLRAILADAKAIDAVAIPRSAGTTA